MKLRNLAALASAFLLCTVLHAQQPPAYHPQKGTQILWDKYGVPHIFAKSTTDMFYAYGYAQMEAHGNLILTGYAEGRGRASEYFGAGVADKNLKSDRWIWLNEVPERAALWLTQQTPEFRSYLDAFTAGINAYATAHPEALSEENKRVLPITTVDLIAHQQHFVNFEFVASQRLTESPATTKASLEEPGVFSPDNPDMQDGSNGWAIAPSHTVDGHAMLLMNPHLAWGGQQSYFECHLQAPGINLYGAAQLGLPSMRFLFSDYIAITNTVNTNNGALLYRIAEQDGGYNYDGKVLQYERATHPFKVRHRDGSFTVENVEVLRTVHGPIIRRDSGAPIALHVAGLDKPFLLDQVYRMSIAHNLTEYQTQLRRLQIPMYNILYADRDGHIEYLFNGAIPRRNFGDFAMWQHPMPGDNSRIVPTEYLTYDELPKLIDPPSGYVQNSNEPPWDAAWPTMLDPKNYPPYVSATFAHFRTDRALRMLSEDKKITYQMLLDKKLSTRMEFADRILPDLLAAVDQYGTPRAKEAAAILKNWNHEAEADSRGALLFYTWAQRFVNPTVILNAPNAQRNFAVQYEIDKPLTTPSGLKDPKDAAAMLDAAAEETIKLYGALDTPWGNVMRLQINNQSDGNIAADRGPALNNVDLPGNGGYGNLGIFRVVTYGPLKDGIKTPVHGDGFTIAVEFSKPIKARALVSYGDSSQPDSPHHTDQLPLFEHKQWREVWRTRKQIEAHLEKREPL